MNWTLRAGIFRSISTRPESYLIVYRNTQLDGSADVDILTDPLARSSSYSGEIRASGAFADGPHRYTLHFSARGWDSRRAFGGEDVVSVGQGFIGVYTPFPKPAFNSGPQDNDKVRQGTVGVTYEGRWSGIGELSAGL